MSESSKRHSRLLSLNVILNNYCFFFFYMRTKATDSYLRFVIVGVQKLLINTFDLLYFVFSFSVF